MADNLGRFVKWLDSEGGWHTGRVVSYPCPTIRQFNRKEVNCYIGFSAVSMILVKESCNGELSWVEQQLLRDWQMRSEWEGKVLEEPSYSKDNAFELSKEQLQARYGIPKEQKTAKGTKLELIGSEWESKETPIENGTRNAASLLNANGRELMEPKYNPTKGNIADHELLEGLYARYGKPLGKDYAENAEQQMILDEIDRDYTPKGYKSKEHKEQQILEPVDRGGDVVAMQNHLARGV